MFTRLTWILHGVRMQISGIVMHPWLHKTSSKPFLQQGMLAKPWLTAFTWTLHEGIPVGMEKRVCNIRKLQHSFVPSKRRIQICLQFQSQTIANQFPQSQSFGPNTWRGLQPPDDKDWSLATGEVHKCARHEASEEPGPPPKRSARPLGMKSQFHGEDSATQRGCKSVDNLHHFNVITSCWYALKHGRLGIQHENNPETFPKRLEPIVSWLPNCIPWLESGWQGNPKVMVPGEPPNSWWMILALCAWLKSNFKTSPWEFAIKWQQANSFESMERLGMPPRKEAPIPIPPMPAQSSRIRGDKSCSETLMEHNHEASPACRYKKSSMPWFRKP